MRQSWQAKSGVFKHTNNIYVCMKAYVYTSEFEATVLAGKELCVQNHIYMYVYALNFIYIYRYVSVIIPKSWSRQS